MLSFQSLTNKKWSLAKRQGYKKFHFMAPFLAMAKLKQAWLCSSGLTKKFINGHSCKMSKYSS